jgi:hypothetical protein
MSTAAAPTATPTQVSSGERPVSGRPTRHTPGPVSGSRARGGTVLFQIPFASAMSDSDLALLGHTLDLWTHMHPKMRPDPNSPGVARLDHFSGLFLERGPAEGRWLFEGRTWGHPAPQTVHEWHLLAAQAANQLDPTVQLPERLSSSAPEVRTRLVGEVANRRLARLRRRLVDLQ